MELHISLLQNKNLAYSRHSFCGIIILRLIWPIAIVRNFVYMNNEQFIILIIYSYKYRHDRKHYRWWQSKMYFCPFEHNLEKVKRKMYYKNNRASFITKCKILHFAAHQYIIFISYLQFQTILSNNTMIWRFSPDLELSRIRNVADLDKRYFKVLIFAIFSQTFYLWHLETKQINRAMRNVPIFCKSFFC